MRSKRLLNICLAALVGCAAGLPVQVQADDTEIYLGNDSISEGVLPNVLFILDTSGSMSGLDGELKDRMDRMKDALVTILDQAHNINVGLMRFTDPGGPILFPVANIAADANEVESIGQSDVTVALTGGGDDVEELGGVMLLDSNQLELLETATFGGEGSLTLQVVNGADDAEQSNQFMNNTSGTLEMTDNNSGNRTNGIRFQDVEVPKGANIISATLDFYAGGDDDAETHLRFAGHLVDDAPAFPNSAGSNAPYGRLDELTTARAEWNDVPEWFQGDRYLTPDLSPIVAEIVGQSDWVSGNALAFIVTGEPGSFRRVRSYNDAASRAPILRVDYADPSAGGTQKVGLRYTNVRVPQGVTVTKAVLEFTASGANAEAADVVVYGHDVDDAPAFGAGDNDLSNRTKTTAAVTWEIDPWTAKDQPEQSADLAPVVQEIVNRSGWCGGQDIVFILESGTNSGPRRAYSFDDDPSRAPKLKIEYDEDTELDAGEGCIIQEIIRQVGASKDDAEQIDNTLYLTSDTIEMTTDSYGTRTDGFRFQNIQIPSGAEILSATVGFHARFDDSGATSLTVHGDDADDSPEFNSGADVSDRTLTSASVSWNDIPAWTQGNWYESPDVSSIVTEITGRGGWLAGNDMSFIVSGSGKRRVTSYNAYPSKAAVLKLVIKGKLGQQTNTSLTTVRERLKELVGQLDHDGYTPIVDTLYEAARYYRGEEVYYGKTRGEGGSSVERNTRVSHPASYKDGVLVQPAGCVDSNLSAEECRKEKITGHPMYRSPIEEGCQANYIVLLTDGFANHNNSETEVKEMIGASACDAKFTNLVDVESGERCGVDLARYLHTQDQRSTISGDNTITTYTIGFNISNQFLKDVADAGGGDFYEANTSDELASVFQQIIAEVLSHTTSFAAPSLSVNAFNKLFHRNEVYFSLFKPTANVRWDGNVKKYQLCDDPATDSCELGEILDAREPPDGPQPAIGDDNRIRDDALSFWSATVDGSEILVGGAGEEIPAHGARRLYTYTGATAPTNVDLAGSAHTLSASNSLVTVGMLGGSEIPTDPTYMSVTEREELIDWMRGRDVDDEDGDGDTDEERYAFHDPLHSSPVAVTYGGTNEAPVIKLFVGTNDGGLRMLNGHTGEEEWMFYPQQLLAMQRELRTGGNGGHLYGMDATPTIWTNDENNDGVISPDVDINGDGIYEFVRIFIGMRRGGSSLFALDVTPTTTHGPLTDPNEATGVTPTLLWRIDAGGTDFPRLGQTWSRPKLIKVGYGTSEAGAVVPKHALVFAAGYDDAQDTAFASGGVGNAIYLIEPATGARLFWVSSADATEHGGGDGIEVAAMNYPIPSDVATMDSDYDGLTDRIYIGDTGGQLWRIDLAADTTTEPGIKGTVGKIATVADPAETADRRKFFYPPDVVQVRGAQYSSLGNYDLISIVSGNRATPLNLTVKDRFYAIRDWHTGRLSDGDPADTSDDDGLADGLTTVQGPTVALGGGLVDLTDINGPTGDALIDLKSGNGYFIDFEGTGEKGLSSPVILEGKVFFTTYRPDANTSGSSCSLAEGGGVLYGINVLTGEAMYNWDGSGDDSNLTKSDRTYTLGAGIPSSAVPIFQEPGITLLIGGGGGATTVDPDIDLPRNRTFWFNQAH